MIGLYLRHETRGELKACSFDQGPIAAIRGMQTTADLRGLAGTRWEVTRPFLEAYESCAIAVAVTVRIGEMVSMKDILPENCIPTIGGLPYSVIPGDDQAAILFVSDVQ